MARFYWRDGRFADATEMSNKALNMAQKLAIPRIEAHAYLDLALVLPSNEGKSCLTTTKRRLRLGFEEAEEEFRKSLDPSEVRPDLPLMLSMASSADLAYIYARLDRREDAIKIFNNLKEASKSRFVSPTSMAQVHLALGEKDEAMRLLEKAYDEGDNVSMWGLKGDPAYDELLGF